MNCYEIWDKINYGVLGSFRPLFREALEKAGIPMLEADVTMIPQNWVELTDEEAIKKMQRILDLLDEDDDVQAVYHNWDE